MVKRKYTIEIGEKLDNTLTSLSERQENASRAEVIRNAVSLYAMLVDMADQNGRISLIDKEGEKVKVQLF